MQLPTRSSRIEKPNPDLVDLSGFTGDNVAFFAEALRRLAIPRPGKRHLYFALVGSCDLLGNALRRAQSVVRRDLRPGLWSHAFAFVLPNGTPPADVGSIKIRGVPLDTRNQRLPEPAWNGVTESDLSLYASPERDANVALLSIELSEAEAAAVIDRFYTPNADRVRFDLWNSLCAWQRYYWSFGSEPNPFQQSVPMPSSHFIEHCYDAIQLDLTPATSERHSAPEFLWGTVKYWYEAYTTRGNALRGVYLIRDPGCTTMPPENTAKPRAKPPTKDDFLKRTQKLLQQALKLATEPADAASLRKDLGMTATALKALAGAIQSEFPSVDAASLKPKLPKATTVATLAEAIWAATAKS